MHKIPTDAFDMLVTLEKRPFERAGREVVVRLLDETLPDGTKLVAASVASELEEEVADIKPIYDVVIAAAPDYNIDIIKNKLAIN